MFSTTRNLFPSSYHPKKLIFACSKIVLFQNQTCIPKKFGWYEPKCHKNYFKQTEILPVNLIGGQYKTHVVECSRLADVHEKK